MRLNAKILSLLIVLIAIVSISAVSAADDIDDATIAIASDDSASIEAVSDDSDVVAATHTIAADSSATQIQAVINNTTAGDTISFAENAVYNLGNNSVINIEHTLILQGNNATLVGAQGFLIQGGDESTDGSQILNLNFVMVSDTGYNGRALDIRSTNNVVVDNCSFLNGNAGIRVQRCINTTLTNNYFVGSTNESSIGTRNEEGTKAINLMGGSNHQIEGNYFGADLLDGVSIASGAQSVNMINNIFEDNWYGIFYGGGVTDINTTGNKYNNCKVYAIGLVKAAGETIIDDNEFTIPEEADAAIYIEQGNTAHGAPSNIEDITITNNDFTAANETGEIANAVYVSTNNGALAPVGTVTIEDNNYGVNVAPFTLIQGNWDVDGNDIVISPTSLDSAFVTDGETEYKFGETYEIQLIGDDGTVLSNQDVVINITQDSKAVDTLNVTTNGLGIAKVSLIYGVGTYDIKATFNGATVSGKTFGETEGEFNATVSLYDSIIVGKNVTVATASRNRFEITLKDSNNQLLTNQTVQFTVNGVTYNRTSDENGVAGLNINSLNMGNYNITVAYTDAAGTKFNKTYDMSVVQANSTIKSTPVQFEGKGHQFVAQLVDQLGQPIKDAVIAFHINGKAYYKSVNETGHAYLNINLNPGVYNMYMSFDGTLLYAASNGGSEVTVI